MQIVCQVGEGLIWWAWARWYSRGIRAGGGAPTRVPQDCRRGGVRVWGGWGCADARAEQYLACRDVTFFVSCWPATRGFMTIHFV